MPALQYENCYAGIFVGFPKDILASLLYLTALAQLRHLIFISARLHVPELQPEAITAIPLLRNNYGKKI